MLETGIKWYCLCGTAVIAVPQLRPLARGAHQAAAYDIGLAGLMRQGKGRSSDIVQAAVGVVCGIVQAAVGVVCGIAQAAVG